MALSLQGQVFGETYGQLLHAGSPSLTGNNIYTPAGCCIPLSINTSTLDYDAPGVIKGDLTVSTLLSGQGFKDCGNVNNGTNSCIFGKNQTIGAGQCVCVVGGLSSYFTGSKIKAFGTYNVHLSAPTTIINCRCSLALGGYSNRYNADERATIIGGRMHTIDSCDLVVVGGRSHTIPSNCLSRIIGGHNLYIESASTNTNFIATGVDSLTSTNSTGGIQYFWSGQCNDFEWMYGGCMHTGSNIRLCGFGAVSFCSYVQFSGKDTCIRINTSPSRDLVMYTGLCNHMHSAGSVCGVFPYNGQFNSLSTYGTARDVPQLTNGLCNSIHSRCTCNAWALFNGQCNCMNTPATFYVSRGLFMGTGYQNTLSCMTNSDSHILNGSNNLGVVDPAVFAAGKIVTIYNGKDNINCGGNIYHGLSSCVLGTNSSLFGGTCNSLHEAGDTTSLGHAIFGGCCNTIEAVYDSFILGGVCNKIPRAGAFPVCSQNQLIGGGVNNTVCACCCNKSIWSGENNLIDNTTFRHTSILGGRNNRSSYDATTIIGSSLSATSSNDVYVNNLIITDLPVGSAGLNAKTWYREIGSDIVKQV